MPSCRLRSWTLTVILLVSFCLWVITFPDHLVPGPTFETPISLIQILWEPVSPFGLLIVLGSLLLPLEPKASFELERTDH